MEKINKTDKANEFVMDIRPVSTSSSDENSRSSMRKIFQSIESPLAKSNETSNYTPQKEDTNNSRPFQSFNECKSKEFNEENSSKYVKNNFYEDGSTKRTLHFQPDSPRLELSSSVCEIESEKSIRLNRLNSLKRRIKNLKTAVIGGNHFLKAKNSYVPTINGSSDSTTCDSKLAEENENENTDVKLSKSTSSSIKTISSHDVMKKSFSTPKTLPALSRESSYSVNGRSNKENDEQNIKQSRQFNVTPSQATRSPYFSQKPMTTTSNYQSDSLEYMLSYGSKNAAKNTQWYDADPINFYQPQPGQPIQIAMNVVLANLADIDTAKMSYRMKLDIWVAWPLTESEVKSYYTNPDVWKPFLHPEPVPATISIESSEKMKFLSGRTTQVFLWRGKFVACECTQVTATFLENLELVNFPFDCQHFHCKIGIRCDTDIPVKIVQEKIVFTTIDSIGGFNNLDGRAMKTVEFDEKACYFNVKSHMLTLKDFSLEGIECEIENTGKCIIFLFFNIF